MITSAKFSELKKGNISKNESKTKERIPFEYKASTTAQKKELNELTGFSPNNYYAVAKSGTASPKVVVAMSQILNLNPLYLTGESDIKSPCDAVALAKIIAENNTGTKRKSAKAKPAVSVDKPAAKPVKPAKSAKKAKKAAPKAAEKKLAKPAVKVKTVNSALVKPVKSLNIEDSALIKLLEALAIRAKFSAEAAATYEAVKALLLK
jgi:hypothetical protein